MIIHYSYLSKIANFSQKFLIQNEFVEKIAIIINYTLDVYVIKLRNKYKKHELEIKKILIDRLIKIYLAFEDIYEFQQFVVQDERSFHIKNFYIIKEKLEKESYKKKIDPNLISKFNIYISKLENQIEIIRNETVI